MAAGVVDGVSHAVPEDEGVAGVGLAAGGVGGVGDVVFGSVGLDGVDGCEPGRVGRVVGVGSGSDLFDDVAGRLVGGVDVGAGDAMGDLAVEPVELVGVGGVGGDVAVASVLGGLKLEVLGVEVFDVGNGAGPLAVEMVAAVTSGRALADHRWPGQGVDISVKPGDGGDGVVASFGEFGDR